MVLVLPAREGYDRWAEVYDHLSEHAVDAALAARYPRGEKYVGWPMLLVMRLTAR